MNRMWLLKCTESPITSALVWGSIALINTIALMGDITIPALWWGNLICLAISLVGFEAACRASCEVC